MHVRSLASVIEDEDRLKVYIETELEPLYQRIFTQENMEMFLTVDSSTAKDTLDWAERVSRLFPSSSSVITTQPTTLFGVKSSNASDRRLHVQPGQVDQIMMELPGAMGQAYKGNKNIFTTVPIDTNHVMMSFPSICSNEPGFDGVHLLTSILSSKFLLKHIREEGGAYGTGAAHPSSMTLFSSYDDPNVLRSVDQFKKGCQWIREGNFTQKDIEEARLSVFGDMDVPKEPQSFGIADIYNKKSAEQRQQQRDLLLNVTKEELVETAKKSFAYESVPVRTMVFGNENSVKEIEKDDSWIIESM